MIVSRLGVGALGLGLLLAGCGDTTEQKAASGALGGAAAGAVIGGPVGAVVGAGVGGAGGTAMQKGAEQAEEDAGGTETTESGDQR
jgi:hypothetical protein